MADYNVQGRNILCEMRIVDEYVPIFCAKSGELIIEQDEIETTHVNSQNSREYVPGMSNSLFNMTGLTRINNNDGRINVIYLMQSSVRRDIWPLRVTLTNNENEVATISFNAFIKSVSWNKDASTLSNSFVNWRVTGDPSFGTAIGPPAEPICEVKDALYLTLAEGATSVTDPLLEDSDTEETTILAVTREGTGYDETTGTPGNRQFRHNAVTGVIEFGSSWPGNPGGEVIYVLYKKTTIAP